MALECTCAKIRLMDYILFVEVTIGQLKCLTIEIQFIKDKIQTVKM